MELDWKNLVSCSQNPLDVFGFKLGEWENVDVQIRSEWNLVNTNGYPSGFQFSTA